MITCAHVYCTSDVWHTYTRKQKTGPPMPHFQLTESYTIDLDVIVNGLNGIASNSGLFCIGFPDDRNAPGAAYDMT